MQLDSTPQRVEGDGDAGAGSSLHLSTDTGMSGQIKATVTHHIPPGHHYENNTTVGNAKAHLGDQYHYHGGQHSHYHPSATTTDHAHGVTATQLQDSLSFSQMDFRYAAIQAAHRHTCQWLFDTTEYRRWRDPELRRAHNGLLWVKGKPGSGKSTITKVALQHARKTHLGERNLCFFFNGRGGSLEKSVEGMFRSLLYHIVPDVPWLLEVANARVVKEYGKGGWPLELLKDLFREAMYRLGRTVQVTCYIDALDEGDNDDDIRDMVGFLAELTESAVSEDVRLSVYLASRHYPNISVPHSEIFVLEENVFHSQDIAGFVKSKLNCKQGPMREELTAEIVRRSSGVFLWVVLTVRLLNKSSDQGNLYELQSTLRAIPQELNSLFEALLRDGAKDKRLLPALLWILYANRALRPEELYFAIRTSTDSLSVLSVVWDHEVVDETAIRNFVVSSSKGLAEVVPGSDPRSYSVQFIHDSVRTFLTSAGMRQIESVSGEGVIGEYNVRLAQRCRDYLELCFRSGAKRHLEYAIARKAIGPKSHTISDHSLLDIVPLLPYALDGILQHSEKAASSGTDVQIPLKDTLRSRLWLGLKGILKHPKSLPGILHIFTHERCTNLIGQELERCLLHNRPACINEAFLNDYQSGVGHMRGTPLQVAVARHFLDIADFLLEKGAEVNISCAGAPNALHIIMSRYSWATKPEDMAIIEALLRSGADVSATNETGESALHAASRIGSDLLELLLRAGANKDTRDSRGRTVLDVAILSKNLSIVKNCIAHGMSVNASDVNGNRTLHAAIRLCAAAQAKDPYATIRTHNEFEIIELLLESGADMHATDALGRTALSVALECRSAVMVEKCIMHGADVNARLNNGDGILHTAAKLANGPERSSSNVIEFLIQSGADVHAMDAMGMTPLDVAAATGGDKQLAKTYIQHGAVVTARNGPSLLRHAILSMDIEMVKLYLDRDVDVNACDADGETMLHKLRRQRGVSMHIKASESRRYYPPSSNESGRSMIYAILRLLLERGANVNSRNDKGETPLHAIIQRKHVTEWEVDLLVRYGADTEARDNWGYTAAKVADMHRNARAGDTLRHIRFPWLKSLEKHLQE